MKFHCKQRVVFHLLKFMKLKKEDKKNNYVSDTCRNAGIPTGWKDQYYAREGDSLVPLSLEKNGSYSSTE